MCSPKSSLRTQKNTISEQSKRVCSVLCGCWRTLCWRVRILRENTHQRWESYNGDVGEERRQDWTSTSSSRTSRYTGYQTWWTRSTTNMRSYGRWNPNYWRERRRVSGGQALLDSSSFLWSMEAQCPVEHPEIRIQERRPLSYVSVQMS